MREMDGVQSSRMRTRQRGFTLLEVLITITVIMLVAAFAAPSMMRMVYGARLRARAADLSDLHQRARILAAKNNQIYQILYVPAGAGAPPYAFIDVDQNGIFNVVNDPVMYFTGTVVPAAGAPAGAGGVPNYVLVGDSGPGAWDNTMTLAYGPRGLPCAYPAQPGPCLTPAIQYFVYYLQDVRPGGKWAAVVVTKSGRSKVVMWSGTAWM